jgi:hypothetical protein
MSYPTDPLESPWRYDGTYQARHLALLDQIKNGLAGVGTYVFHQGVADTVWTIQHNLGKFPSVSVVDSMNTIVIGAVTYIDNNNLTITFNAAMSGKAFLN